MSCFKEWNIAKWSCINFLIYICPLLDQTYGKKTYENLSIVWCTSHNLTVFFKNIIKETSINM